MTIAAHAPRDGMVAVRVARAPVTLPKPSRGVVALDISCVVLLIVTGALVFAHAPPATRLAPVLATMLVSPGYAAVRLSRLRIGPDTLALTIGLSLATFALIGTAEAESGWWHPHLTFLILGAGSVAALAACHWLPLEPTRGLGNSRTTAVTTAEPAALAKPRVATFTVTALALLLAVAVATWAVAVRDTSVANLTSWGLLPRLPADWYVGIGIIGIGGVLSQLVPGKLSHRLLSCGYLLALLLYVDGTAPAIETTARYAWLYKHVGVTRYVIVHHGVDNYDIYQRWPGMFSAAAIFSTLSGYLSPLSYVAWGELFFTLLDVIALFALARRFTSERGAWVACFFFVASNWIGQQYFSPQAFAFFLAIVCLVVTAALLDGAAPNVLRRAARRFLPTGGNDDSNSGAARAKPAVTATGVRRAYVIAAVVVLDAGVIVSHQLSPYILLADLAALAILGFLRPKWIVGFLVVLTGAYLAPNIAFLHEHFALFSGFDPFRNATQATDGTGAPVTALRQQSYLAVLLSLLIVGAGFAGIVLTVWRRHSRRAGVVVATLFFAPVVSLLQAYGGEARFRVLLFMLPACAIGAAWLWEAARRRGWLVRAIASLAILPLPLGLLVPTFFGKEAIYYMPAGEVAASKWIFTTADRHQVVAVVNEEFPSSLGAGYTRLSDGIGQTVDLDGSQVYTQELKAGLPVPEAVVATLRHYSPFGYVVFGVSQARFARDYQVDGGLPAYDRLQQAVAHSRLFKRVYVNSDAVIYQVRR